jgi:hypothetical protein
VITSKYTSAFSAIRPTLRMSLTPAMPCTTVTKMMGAIIMRMSLMKPSPSGFIAEPAPGASQPTTTPISVPTRT